LARWKWISPPAASGATAQTWNWAREWRLLEHLALRRGQVVPRAEIEAHIYDERGEPMSHVVDAAVCSLRRRIGADLIHAHRGLGFVLKAGGP
jgi:DNA-binding response OmpR family regulator